MGNVNGTDNFRIFHATLQDAAPDALAAAFNAEFYNAAICVRQAEGSFFIEKAHMGIDHKGEGTDFFIRCAKLLHIFKIKRKKIVIKNKHRNISIILQQIFNLLYHLIDFEMTDVIQAFEAASKVLAIVRYQLVIKTVGAGKGATPGGH